MSNYILGSLMNYTRSSLASVRTIFTSPVLQIKLNKRRKTYPFFWLQDKYSAYYDENLTPQNEEFFQQFLKDKYLLNKNNSPLKSEPWIVDEPFTEGTARTGLIAKKLGSFPMWTKTGQRLLTTCLYVGDNHVIKYHSPEEFAEKGRPWDSIKHAGMGCIIVGAESDDPRKFTAEYNGLFTESGVMPKKKLTRFFISHKSRLEPGTPLVAAHFKPGMYVDVYGKSKWQGHVGLRRLHRGLKLGCATHGNTKNHNRIGSIGRGRKECGPLKGRRMPAAKGNERVTVCGLKIWRVNTKYNLIFVHGPNVPGDNGAYVNVMDCRIKSKTPREDDMPPFPTISLEQNTKLDEELYHKDLHKADDPSVVFVITEEEKKAAAAQLRRQNTAKTAQKGR